MSRAPTGAEPARRRSLRFVALGDSYTIGTATRSPADRWPNQLVARLGGDPPVLALVANLAVNGSTSGDVIDRELPLLDEARPEIASLLIGVNDVVQGVSPATYRANVDRILEEIERRVPATRIVTVATPDYTVTPQGGAYGDPERQSAGIRTMNAILLDVASAHGVAFVDVFDVSLRAATDRSLVADDGLHPSAAQYALWVERIEPVVARLVAV